MFIEDFIENIPEKQRKAIRQLRDIIQRYLPEGFEETIKNGMIHYVVPHSLYPDGYHVSPKEPLPFISLAAMKNHIAIYHMGLVGMEQHYNWFIEEYPKHMDTKLDMGKSCIRFKNPNKIPYSLIAELVTRISVNDWINSYDHFIKTVKE